MKFWRSEVKFRKEQVLANLDGLIHGNEDWAGITPVFIISTGRTGTNFLSHFFNNNFEGVYAVHEPSKDTFDLNINFVRKRIGYGQTVRVFKFFRKGIFGDLISRNIPYYIESNNNLSFLIPVLRTVFPNCKIVYIQRNGIDFVRSLYSKKGKLNTGESVYILSDKDARNRLKSDFFKDDPYYGKWFEMDRFERVCWLWSKKDSFIYDSVENDENTYKVKFESLFKEKDLNIWNELLEFCGLNERMKADFDIVKYINDAKSNNTKIFELGRFDEWPDDFKHKFDVLAGDHMQRLGYKYY